MSRRIAIIAAVVLAVALPAWGQTQITTGVIQGTVSDQSGALVPGAFVEARNVDINSARAQTTLADGRFVFLQLRPGRYTADGRPHWIRHACPGGRDPHRWTVDHC